MKIEGKNYKTIWFENNLVKIIDQTKLPHKFEIKELKTCNDAVNAIKIMEVRGAPLIGATAAYGLVSARHRAAKRRRREPHRRQPRDRALSTARGVRHDVYPLPHRGERVDALDGAVVRRRTVVQ